MKNYFIRITMVLAMLFISIGAVFAQKSYTYGYKVEYNVTHNGKTGLLMHLNARIVGHRAHTVEVGITFLVPTNDGGIEIIASHGQKYIVTSDDKTYTDVQVFIPYEDYMFSNAIGQYTILDHDINDYLYLDFDNLFEVDKSRVQLHSQGNSRPRVTIKAISMNYYDNNGKEKGWTDCDLDIVITEDDSYIIKYPVPETIRIIKDKGRIDNSDGSFSINADAVNQNGKRVRYVFIIYPSGKKFLYLEYSDFAVMYKLKN